MSVAFTSLPQSFRFVAIGVLNTAFAYCLYALLLLAGLHLFIAQIVATVIAIIFNFFTYSRHVFHGTRASIARFGLSYGLNYLVSLTALAGCIRLVASPYLAGFMAMIMATAVNFFILKRLVFTAGALKAGSNKSAFPKGVVA